MTNAIEIKQLSIGLQIDKQSMIAVENISFNLQPGKTLALLGESGCGKSLTSLALMRLLPINGAYSKQSSIEMAGLNLLNLPEQLMRALRGNKIAIIFQEPMISLNPVLNIGEQLAEAIQKNPTLTRADIHGQMLQLLQDVEISQPTLRLKQYPHQLSGGQKQRIIIAMALAGRPDVLIADEPTTALDVTVQAQILKLLKKLQQTYQMSLLLITHDLGVVKFMADTVCVMYAGQIVEAAPANDFFQLPLHPYAQQLFLALPSFSKRTHRLPTIPGQVPSLNENPSGCRFHPRCAHAFNPCQTEPPKLQHLYNKRQVRCHLYPALNAPPTLTNTLEHWATPPKSNEIVLRVNQLSVYFNSKHQWFNRSHQVFKAVDNLSFILYKGKTLALVGESGCGKTTTARAILKLLPISTGEVLFKDQNISTLKKKAIHNFRKHVQIIFQDPYSSMNPRMTIADIIAEGMRAQRIKNSLIQNRLRELLDQVNLPLASLKRYPHQFSGGQRQRICIARALATKPELIICDEPTSALDMSVQAQILNLLKTLQYELRLTYLFITHNIGVVSYIADDILVMRDGQAIEMGSCETLLKNPKNVYTRQLVSSVIKL